VEAAKADAAPAEAAKPEAAKPAEEAKAEVKADEAKPETKAEEAKVEAKADAAPEGFSVPKSCEACHGDLVEKFAKTTHGRANDPRNPASGKSCEACHGSMAAHVAAGGGKDTVGRILGKDSKLSAKEKSESCLACHSTGHRNEWKGSVHEKKGVSCVDCHSTHGGNKMNLAKETEAKTCAQCHPQINSLMNRNSHHPIKEGKITCGDCHKPHGSDFKKLLGSPNANETCFKCHAEKRGPFVWEHRPVTEDCAICHTPHGSSHSKLMVERADFLCQSCHSISRHPGTPYSINPGTNGSNNWQKMGSSASRVVYKGCINCHSNIHGSNHPSGKTLIR
jgi:DmsE family decaheme c-type cytochrome